MNEPLTGTTAEWDEDDGGFTLEGTHYSLAPDGECDVEVTVGFADWEKYYKSTSLVSVAGGGVVFKVDDSELEHGWEVFMEGIDQDVLCDLFPELEDYDGVLDESVLSPEQIIKYYAEAFKRGACRLRHILITVEVYADSGEDIERDDIARAVGLDPSHTSVAFQG